MGGEALFQEPDRSAIQTGAVPLGDALRGFTRLARLALHRAQSTTILCHCDLIPENVAGVGDGGLVVLDWERAGAEAAERELGSDLGHWRWSSEAGVDGEGVAVLTEADRTEGGTFPSGPGLFRASISAWLNYTFGVAAGALRASDPDRRRDAARPARSFLTRPLSPDVLERLLSGIGGGAHA